MNTPKLTVFVMAICIAISMHGQEEKETPKTTFKFGGFVKADYLQTTYYNGDHSGPGRDFHIPSKIPVKEERDLNRHTDFHIKESRFNFDVNTLAGGKNLRAFIELDFQLSPGGDERVSNSYSPRVRHFFLEYDKKFLFGQTWSTFMVVTLPDELDFTGAPEGLVFTRQTQARFTFGSWQFALENPFTTYTQGPTGARGTSETAVLPDLVVRKNFKGEWGNFSVAAIGRQLGYKYETDKYDNTLGAGITLGGKIKVGERDDIRFVGTVGTGLGRYVALNFVNAAYINADQELQSIFTTSGYFSYLRGWSSRFKSSFSIAYFKANNDEVFTGPNANASAGSLSGNIMFTPAKNFMIGLEEIVGFREVEDGTNGVFTRTQISAKYAFSFKTSVN